MISIILVLPPMVIESWESYGWSENTLAQSILTAALSFKHAARTHEDGCNQKNGQ